MAAIFGDTCINDVTAFAQWGRDKSFDTFGAFGPAIATDVKPKDLWLRPEHRGAAERASLGVPARE